eukprot:snap_masked-scaffold_8-processed-gene-4.31-mRNA-1 protein AED:1.00 eAED:1.00 QI:0/0/0/0/1/1/2/0/64
MYPICKTSVTLRKGTLEYQISLNGDTKKRNTLSNCLRLEETRGTSLLTAAIIIWLNLTCCSTQI